MKFLSNTKLSLSISPLTKWILTILILGAGIVLVFVFYAQEQSRNSSLRDDIDDTAAALVKNSLDKQNLQSTLAGASLNLAQMQSGIPAGEANMFVEGQLYRAAADAGVSIDSISITELKTVKSKNAGSYQAMIVTVSMTGPTDSQLRFIGIVGGYLPSAEIVSASLAGESMSLVANVYVR